MAMDRKHITFEDYLSFSRDQDANDLNIHKLKHILNVNSFGGHKYLTRKEIIEAIKSATLIPPTRSTINHSSDQQITSRHVPPSLKDLRNDIQEIGWQECPIGSIVTLDPATFGVAKSPVNNISPVNNKKKRGRNEKGIEEGNEVEKSNVNKKKRRVRKCKKIEGNEVERPIVNEKKKRVRKGKENVLLALDVPNKDDIEMCESDLKNSTVNNKEKKVIKVNIKCEEDELVADDVTNPYDVKLTSPIKKTSQTTRVKASMLNEADEFSWINKGFQKIKGSPHPRNYFKCKNWNKGCPARRSVDKDPNDSSILIITYYRGQHNH